MPAPPHLFVAEAARRALNPVHPRYSALNNGISLRLDSHLESRTSPDSNESFTLLSGIGILRV